MRATPGTPWIPKRQIPAERKIKEILVFYDPPSLHVCSVLDSGLGGYRDN